GGVNSGFMIAQVTAASLACENKALAVPRSVDSLPTSANQEDHVSMATNAALRLAPSPRLLPALQRIRREAAYWDRDRAFAPDLARVRTLVEQGAFVPFIGI